MTPNEKNFMEYMYININNFNLKEVNEAHKILYETEAPTGCNSCLITVSRNLKQKYILLKNATGYDGHIISNEEFFKAVVATTEIKKLKKIHKQNIPDDGLGEAQNFIV